MRKASIQDLRTRTSEIVREAADGATIFIERRGEPVAELRPLKRGRKVSTPLPDMTDVWARIPPVSTDSSAFLEEDR